MKKLIAKLAIAATLAVPLAAVGQVATADNNKAQAYAAYTYPTTRCIGRDLYRYTIIRVDYNWFEEVFEGKRDYTTGVWGSLIQRNAPQCGIVYV